MADGTPDALDLPQKDSEAVSAPDELFDLKAFELLDDIYNAVRPSSFKEA